MIARVITQIITYLIERAGHKPAFFTLEGLNQYIYRLEYLRSNLPIKIPQISQEIDKCYKILQTFQLDLSKVSKVDGVTILAFGMVDHDANFDPGDLL